MRSQNELSFAQNELVGDVNESGETCQPYPRTDPSPVVLWLVKAPEPDALHGGIGARIGLAAPASRACGQWCLS